MVGEFVPKTLKLKNTQNIGMYNSSIAGLVAQSKNDFNNSIFSGYTSSSSSSSSSIKDTTKTMNTIAIVGGIAAAAVSLGGIAAMFLPKKTEGTSTGSGKEQQTDTNQNTTVSSLKNAIETADKTYDYKALAAEVTNAWAAHAAKQAELDTALEAEKTTKQKLSDVNANIAGIDADIKSTDKEVGICEKTLDSAEKTVSDAEKEVGNATTPEAKRVAQVKLNGAVSAQKKAQDQLDQVMKIREQLKTSLKKATKEDKPKAETCVTDAEKAKKVIENDLKEIKNIIEKANEILEIRDQDVKDPNGKEKQETVPETPAAKGSSSITIPNAFTPKSIVANSGFVNNFIRKELPPA